MEPNVNRSSSPTDSVSSYHSAAESLRQSADISVESRHGHRLVDTVDMDQVLKLIPSHKDDGSCNTFPSLRDKQVDTSKPEPSRFQRVVNWFWGVSPEPTETSNIDDTSSVTKPETDKKTTPAPVDASSTDATPEPQRNWLVRGVRDYVVAPIANGVSNYVLSPVNNYVVTPIGKHVVKPVANQVITRPKNFLYQQAQAKFASGVRYQLLERAGVKFELDDEIWQQIFIDTLATAFKDLDPEKVGVHQNLVIPWVNINTRNGPVRVENINLSACIEKPDSFSTDIVNQKRKVTINVNHVECNVDIPVKYKDTPVKLRCVANKGKMHLATNIDKTFMAKSAYTWFREGKDSPNHLHDDTAVQVSLDELKVYYSDTRKAFEFDGNHADPAGTDPVLAEFDCGEASFKHVNLCRKLNLVRDEVDQTAVATVEGMKIDFKTDPNRPSVVALNTIELSDMDDSHNGFLDCQVTLQPQLLKHSSSMLPRLVSRLLSGKTKVSLHAPMREGDIALKNLQLTKKQWEALPPEERKGKGYVEVESRNPLVQLLMGPLLRSSLTRIVPTPRGPCIKVGAQLQIQLPGLIAGSGEKDDHGTVVMTELFDKIGGKLLNTWHIVKSKLIICPRKLERQCVQASREQADGLARPVHSRELVMIRKELKKRQHHSEALRASQAIPAAVYKRLIRDCEDPLERAEYYKIAHELTEIDPPKSVAIFAALLNRKHFAEEPKTADPKWLTDMAVRIKEESPENAGLVIDTLSFAYKSDPFSGSEAMCQLLKLVKDEECSPEVVTRLIINHIQNGRFTDSPKALAQTITAVEKVIGADVVEILKVFPARPLAELIRTDTEVPALIDDITTVMRKYNMNVSAAEVSLHAGETLSAQTTLETAIQKNDPEALKARIMLEVKHGTIGHPRFVDAAKLLVETLCQPALPEPMQEAGTKCMYELWQHTHDNPEVAAAFGYSFMTGPEHPYNQFLTDLFSISRDEMQDSAQFVMKLHSIREKLLEALNDNKGVTEEQRFIIRYFSTLISNIQDLHDRTEKAGSLMGLQQAGTISLQQLKDVELLTVDPVRVNLGTSEHRPDTEHVVPQWVQTET